MDRALEIVGSADDFNVLTGERCLLIVVHFAGRRDDHRVQMHVILARATLFPANGSLYDFRVRPQVRERSAFKPDDLWWHMNINLPQSAVPAFNAL